MGAVDVSHDVADASLADAGRARIEWAEAQMPVLRHVREQLGTERPLAGLTIGACLHITAETAVLVQVLQAGGAGKTLQPSLTA